MIRTVLGDITKIDTVKQFLEENPGKIDEVVWVLFDEKTKTAYDKEVDRIHE